MAGRPRTRALLDGFVQIVVAGMLLVHVLPHAVAEAGAGAIVTFIAGAGLAALAHRAPGGERGALGLSVIALAAHGLTDGASLALPGDAGALLAEAVVLHTLPLALAVWRVARSRAGLGWAVGALVASFAATAVGFAASDAVLSGASPMTLALAQCAAAGALLHVLGHLGHEEPDHAPPVVRFGVTPAGVGALGGVVALWALGGEPHGSADGSALSGVMLRIAAHAAPPLLVGYLAAAGLAAFAPRRATGAIGSLVRTVAGPQVGPVALLLSATFLGLPLAIGRALAAALVGVGAAVVAGPLVAPPPAAVVPADPPREVAFARALSTVVARTAPWVLGGIGLAGLVEVYVPAGALVGVRPWGVWLGAAALAGPIYVCASGVTLLAAALMHKGLSAGGALVLLFVAPAVNVSTVRTLYARIGGRALAVVLVAGSLGSLAVGVVVDALLPAPGLVAAGADAPIGLVAWSSIAVIGAAFLGLLLRGGPSGFVASIQHPDHDGGAT